MSNFLRKIVEFRSKIVFVCNVMTQMEYFLKKAITINNKLIFCALYINRFFKHLFKYFFYYLLNFLFNISCTIYCHFQKVPLKKI